MVHAAQEMGAESLYARGLTLEATPYSHVCDQLDCSIHCFSESL